MSDVVEFTAGSYRFVPSVFQYSAGAAAAKAAMPCSWLKAWAGAGCSWPPVCPMTMRCKPGWTGTGANAETINDTGAHMQRSVSPSFQTVFIDNESLPTGISSPTKF